MRAEETFSFSLNRKARRLLFYSRFLALALLDYYRDDGVEYEELKVALDVPEGSVSPTMLWLKKMEYVEPKEEVVNGERRTVYYITKSGREIYGLLRNYLLKILNLDKQER